MKRTHLLVAFVVACCLSFAATVAGKGIVVGAGYFPIYVQAAQSEGLADQDLLVKSEVETAISMLQAIYIKHQNGEMTLEQAKELGAGLLRELRYGSDGYFWADTAEGINVVHIRKGMEGRNRIEDKDSKGTFYIREFLLRVKESGGGYVNYRFPKKDQTIEQPKRAYVALFKPFGWVVGSGYYY